MSIMNLQDRDVNAFQPLRPTGPSPSRPREIRQRKGRKPKANPRTSWPKWTDFVAVAIVEDEDEFRPTAEMGFSPAKLDEAEWVGMALALTGEPLAEIETEDTSAALRFAVGQYLGLVARHDAERAARGEYDRFIDQRHMERMMAMSNDEPRETDGYAPGYCS